MRGGDVHRIRLIGLALGVVVALCALAPGPASAKTKLLLSEELGTAFATGAAVGMYIEFPSAECVLEGDALIAVNDAKKDLLDQPFSTTLCLDSETAGGSISEIQLTSSGKAKIIAKEADPLKLDPYLEGCVYEFKKLSGTFEAPEVAAIEGVAKGKLSQALTTATGCEKKLVTEFTLHLEAAGELLGR